MPVQTFLMETIGRLKIYFNFINLSKDYNVKTSTGQTQVA